MMLFLPGCFNFERRHAYLSENLTESYVSSRFLPPLDIGVSTRKQVVEKIGEPSNIFENGRIYTYRLIINEWKDGLSDKKYLEYIGQYYPQISTFTNLSAKRFKHLDEVGTLLIVTDENVEQYEKEIISSVGEFHLVLIFTPDGILNRYSLIRIRP